MTIQRCDGFYIYKLPNPKKIALGVTAVLEKFIAISPQPCGFRIIIKE